MRISAEQLVALLGMLRLTADEEVPCDGCLEQMAEFAEANLAGTTIPESLRRIDEHLARCGECREEFESLKLALADANAAGTGRWKR